MYHMNKASIRDLRYRFPRIERLLHRGEEIQITKRHQVIAHLLPARVSGRAKIPDYLGRVRAIYGDRILPVSGAELLAKERSRY
jgi:antitoxin (DNA-binding transcriptional repressor) of toxin-antitoxin stability system